MAATEAVASTGPTPGGFFEPHAHLVGSVPGPDQPVELQDMLRDLPQLSPECQETQVDAAIRSPSDSKDPRG
jgi:hypothetical protein